jgi:hypothetical protein
MVCLGGPRRRAQRRVIMGADHPTAAHEGCRPPTHPSKAVSLNETALWPAVVVWRCKNTNAPSSSYSSNSLRDLRAEGQGLLYESRDCHSGGGKAHGTSWAISVGTPLQQSLSREHEGGSLGLKWCGKTHQTHTPEIGRSFISLGLGGLPTQLPGISLRIKSNCLEPGLSPRSQAPYHYQLTPKFAGKALSKFIFSVNCTLPGKDTYFLPLGDKETIGSGNMTLFYFLWVYYWLYSCLLASFDDCWQGLFGKLHLFQGEGWDPRTGAILEPHFLLEAWARLEFYQGSW